MAQRKETKKTIKARDLKPKKDVKGGRMHSGGGHASDRPGRAGQQMNRRGDG